MEITSVKRVHQSDWTAVGVRFLRARDLVALSKNEEIEEPLYISTEQYEKYSIQSGKVSKGDLLVTGVGTIGVPMLIDAAEPIYFKDGNVIWFKNGEKINGNFLYYSFTAKTIQDFINNVAGIGTVGTYTIDNGKKTPISLPTLAEQTAIGNFFKQLDETIALHQRQSRKYQKLKIGFLNALFCSKIVLNSAKNTNAWEQRKLGEIVTESQRPIQLKDDTEYQLVTVKRRNEGVVARERMFGREILVKNYFEVCDKDFLISKRQIVHGACGLVPKNLDKAVVSNEYMVISSNQYITTEFLALLSKHPDMQKKYLLSSYGVDIEKMVFNTQDWKSRTTVIPTDLAEQTAIGNFFKQLDETIALHQRKIEKYQFIKRLFLEKMFIKQPI